MKIALAVPVLFLAACSSGGGGSDGGVVTAQSVADKIGCTEVAVSTAADRVALASDEAACKLNGDDLTVATFTNNKVRDNYVMIAAAAGGVRMQVGDREVVYGQNAGTADALKDKLGGEIRTK